MAKSSRNKVKSSRKMVKPSRKTGLSFLSLPPEVRNMIYRLLLVADAPLASSKDEGELYFPGYHDLRWASLGEYHIWPAILRVCWQVYPEASSILNCENTFGIRIRDLTLDDNTTVVSSFRSPYVTHGLSSFWDSPMDKFQRIEIYIEGSNYPDVKSSVKELCRCYLSKSHALQHLSIYLYDDSDEVDCEVLRPFEMLRNLRSVGIYGAPPEYLGGMYDMLKQYVEDLNGDWSDLKRASKAVQNLDIHKFKRIRSKILRLRFKSTVRF